MKIKIVILSITVCIMAASCETPPGTTIIDTRPQTNPVQISGDTNRREDPDAANWNIEILDTAKDAEYLSPIEKDVVLEMNKVRTDPKKYAELYIQTELQYYNGNLYQKPGEITIQTQEGKSAVESCVTALIKMSKVSVLTPELGLSLGAKDHTVDQGKSGKTGHDGGDGSTPVTRILRYGKGYTYAGENLA